MADFGTVARPYARAIFDLAIEADALDSWSKALAAAAQIGSDGAARRYMSRPELRASERSEFLRTICSGIDEANLLSEGPGLSVLRLLAENDRLNALPEISAQFDRLKAARENRISVQVTAAAAVDTAQAERIKQALKIKLGREVELELAVDPSLIGGAVIRAEGMVIDGSIKARLTRLASTLIG
jgi:F-type H+-transporting ATPase subunit delta